MGVAILKKDGSVVFRGVFPLEEIGERLSELSQRYAFQEAILGGSTGRTCVLPLLEGMGVQVHSVDERGSSEEARRVYLKECCMTGWKRFFAFFVFLFSSRSFDDWQAVVIGRRFLRGSEKGHE